MRFIFLFIDIWLSFYILNANIRVVALLRALDKNRWITLNWTELSPPSMGRDCYHQGPPRWPASEAFEEFWEPIKTSELDDLHQIKQISLLVDWHYCLYSLKYAKNFACMSCYKSLHVNISTNLVFLCLDLAACALLIRTCDALFRN